MKRRSLLRTLELPKGANPRDLAESLTDDFNVASITGSNGEYEVEMVSPDELVVVINASRARFFIEPRDDDEEDDEDFDDEDEDDPHDVAEDMSFFLSRRLGLVRDEEDELEEAAGTPDDDSDELARRVVARLLDEGLLELVTPRSRPSVEHHLAHCLAQGKNAEKLCDELAEVKGVAELYTSNEQFAEVLASCRKKRAAPAREPVRSVLEKLFSRPPDSPARPVSRPPIPVENTRPKAKLNTWGSGTPSAPSAPNPSLEKQSLDKPTKVKPASSKSAEGKSVEPKVSTNKTGTPKASKTIKKLKSKK